MKIWEESYKTFADEKNYLAKDFKVFPPFPPPSNVTFSPAALNNHDPYGCNGLKASYSLLWY